MAICLAGLLAACTGSGTPHPTTSAARPATSQPTHTPAVSSAAPQSTTPGSTTPSTTRPTSPTDSATAAQRLARQTLASLSEAQRVGQLLMVDCPTTGVAQATITAIRTDDAGSVILDGTSQQGAGATAAITRQLRALAPPGLGLLIGTDQEGGNVQRLQGPGFSEIPSALQQGQLAATQLRSEAQTWGQQLRAAGVDVDLAPVLDTVPDGSTGNPPIGELDREYGHTPQTVQDHGLAVIDGLAAAGVIATAKHFPGLGRVSGNTDTTAVVDDSVTTRNDAYLQPFRAAVQAGVPFVMISNATYLKIDPNNAAAFSSTVITGMLRGDLGFDGVVISDDLGAAKAVSQYSPGERAVRFIAAGGDLVLTVDPSVVGEMTAALLARANADPQFRAQVDAAALRVLQAKAARGLLG